jgi:DNA-binding FadR family transcriptional regulator
MKKNLLTTTLVDQVHEQIMDYIKENKLVPGNSLPNEVQFAEMLGTSRNVVREALSRLKMIGLIESRTRRGMILKEFSIIDSLKNGFDPIFLAENALLDLLGFRVALELGISDDIFQNITEEDINELEEIVRFGVMLKNNEYALGSEYYFHAKLYEITGNETIAQFQKLIRPIMVYIKDNFKTYFEPINLELKNKGLIVTHADLLKCIKERNLTEFKNKLENHFLVYKIFIREKRGTGKRIRTEQYLSIKSPAMMKDQFFHPNDFSSDNTLD